MDGRRRKYSEPLHQIQDQVGARIVTFYRSDVDLLDKIVSRYFRAIESKDHVPDSEWEFGYFGRHHVLVIPSDVIDDHWDKAMVPKFFELQIKTLFQHAWSEAEHDVGYKEGEKPLSLDQKRRLAFTSAQAWGADRIFDELFQELLTPVSASVDLDQDTHQPEAGDGRGGICTKR
jgi:putative GTP pyrophosphokinase